MTEPHEHRRYPANPARLTDTPPAEGTEASASAEPATPEPEAAAPTQDTDSGPSREPMIADLATQPHGPEPAAEPGDEAAPATPDPAQDPAGADPTEDEQQDESAGSDAVSDQLAALQEQLASVSERVAVLDQVRAQVTEIARLRNRDADIIERLHAENTRLRNGEIASAMAPLLNGLLRLHDQMVSLASGDPQSVAGMLRTQLVQLLEVAGGVIAFEPTPGEPFDSSKHSGVGRIPTEDPARDGTVARTVRAGFVRADGTIARVAEVEVCRHTATRSTAPTAPADDPQERP